jgi:hypothetical protein
VVEACGLCRGALWQVERAVSSHAATMTEGTACQWRVPHTMLSTSYRVPRHAKQSQVAQLNAACITSQLD